MKKLRKSKTIRMLLLALVMVLALPLIANAHCDSMDGPTIADAKKAIETNNVNYVLNWVQQEDEKEITELFELTMKVRILSPEAQELADMNFFENLVRIHRAGEGAPYTGVKPKGTPIDEKILAADESLAVGNLSPLEKFVTAEQMPELKERFEKAMALKNFDVNNVEAGREYIEAYVSFFKFAEGEEEGVHNAEAGHTGEAVNTVEAGHAVEVSRSAETLPLIPWSLAGVFATTTLILGVACFRRPCHRK